MAAKVNVNAGGDSATSGVVSAGRHAQQLLENESKLRSFKSSEWSCTSPNFGTTHTITLTSKRILVNKKVNALWCCIPFHTENSLFYRDIVDVHVEHSSFGWLLNSARAAVAFGFVVFAALLATSQVKNAFIALLVICAVAALATIPYFLRFLGPDIDLVIDVCKEDKAVATWARFLGGTAKHAAKAHYIDLPERDAFLALRTILEHPDTVSLMPREHRVHENPTAEPQLPV